METKSLITCDGKPSYIVDNLNMADKICQKKRSTPAGRQYTWDCIQVQIITDLAQIELHHNMKEY